MIVITKTTVTPWTIGRDTIIEETNDRRHNIIPKSCCYYCLTLIRSFCFRPCFAGEAERKISSRDTHKSRIRDKLTSAHLGISLLRSLLRPPQYPSIVYETLLKTVKCTLNTTSFRWVALIRIYLKQYPR